MKMSKTPMPYCQLCGLPPEKCEEANGKRHDRRKFRRTYCEECGQLGDPEFMVPDELWNKHRSGYDYLCLACFTRRLGRKLRVDDLTPCNTNAQLREAGSEHLEDTTSGPRRRSR